MPGRAVFFDRDGVINRAILHQGRPYPPRDLTQFTWMDGIHDTLKELDRRGYRLLVFTNQPDVARGTLTMQQLEEFHRLIRSELPIVRIYACLHDDADGCACRKPKPGMLFAARDDFDLDLSHCWVVGDRWRDIEAGHSAGCRTVLVQYDYDEPAARPDHQIRQIPELLDIIPPTESV